MSPRVQLDEAAQIALTVLKLLSLDANALKALRSQLTEPASSRPKSVSRISPRNEWCPSTGMSTDAS